MKDRDPIFVPADYFREVSLGEIFPQPARPFEVDLGCGDGSFLEQIAVLHPERNFLGVERLLGRVGKTARRIRERGLENARVLRLESAYAVAWLLPRECVSRLHLLFPDPWPKKGHRRKRIVNCPEFIGGLERVLRPGGEVLLKSDDMRFFADAIEAMGERAAFVRAEWPDGAFEYPRTAFERRWMERGKELYRARWRRG